MKHSATTRNQYASGLRRKTRRRDVNHNNVLHSSTRVLQNVSDVPSTVHTPARASGEKAECRAAEEDAREADIRCFPRAFHILDLSLCSWTVP